MLETASAPAASEWNSAANRQDQQHGDVGDIVRQLHYDPAISTLIGDVTGKTVLDAGCGNGYWVRRLSRNAKLVIGVDLSKELLKRAASYANPQNVAFANMDISNLAYADKSFDLVDSNVVLDYVPDIDKFAAESRRVLTNNGSLVFGVIHPLFHTVKMNEGGDMYDKKLGYTDSGSVRRKVYKGALEATIYNRTVGDYIKPFITRGFALEEMLEPPVPEALLREVPRFEADKYLPRFLMLKFKKASD